jgi:RNase P subunit RPR2
MIITRCDECMHPQDRHHLDDGSCQICPCQLWKPFSVKYPINIEEDIRCMKCHRLIENGQPYSQTLDSMMGDSSVVMLTCVYCAGAIDIANPFVLD